ncbi:MAG TPA: response regulator [Candidatus Saccharimonadales bacterium]|nr:response regulator [Candidatus Saccharimonadales bacterium]
MAKILLVEDDNNLREIYGARLTAEGYEIVAAPDGEEALAIAVKEKPDLIISDIMMPKISGFDMLDILRNAPETKDTKIIMMTALSQAEDKERADKLGADLYLVKSQVTLEDVAEAVHKMLNDGPTSPPASPQDQPQSNQAPADAPPPESATPTPPQPVVEQKPAEQTPPVAQPSGTQAPLTSAPSPAPPAAANDPAPVPAPSPPATPPTSDQNQPATAPQQPSAVTPPPDAGQNPPTVSAQPATPQASVAQPDDAAQPPPKPPARKIEVTLPDGDEAQGAKNIDESTKPGDNAQSTDTSAETPDIGPTVAEALAEEEKSLQDQTKEADKEDKPPETSASSISQPSTVVKPQATTVTEEKPAENSEEVAPSSINSSDGTPGKKIIKPINDPTKGPDLDALLAQEQAKENGTGAAANQGEDQGNSTDNKNNPDDLSKISL